MAKKHIVKALVENRGKWFWFVGLYAMSVITYAMVSYGSRWLIHWFN